MKNLSAQQLYLGYIQVQEKNNIRVSLWREHGVYHVRCHDFNTKNRNGWNSFRRLTDARKEFRKMIKLYFPN